MHALGSLHGLWAYDSPFNSMTVSFESRLLSPGFDGVCFSSVNPLEISIFYIDYMDLASCFPYAKPGRINVAPEKTFF